MIRTSGGTGQAVVIFNQSTQKEKSWEFVKWWTGAGAQQRFGGELEALIGVEARWNTANLEALQASLAPPDIASILEQWRWFREPPVVLGGYFTGRHVLNAWNRSSCSAPTRASPWRTPSSTSTRSWRRNRRSSGWTSTPRCTVAVAECRLARNLQRAGGW